MLAKKPQSSLRLLNQLEEHPFSPLVKQAILQIGLNHYNNNNIELAVKQFKQVIENYPNTNESKP